jgi:chlorite dismutase
MLGSAPMGWLCVYPFVRSYDWYLLPEAERREMLREHGMAGRAFPGVQANTVASFALGDWEWLLPLESHNLHDLVDIMRDLRATQARRHVREEIPFHTGRLITLAEVAEVLR